MFEDKYGIQPHKISIWLGLYLMTAVPTYVILYDSNIVYFLLILLIENITTYYLVEDEFVDGMVEQGTKMSRLIFFTGTIIGFISLIALMFLNLPVFMLLLVSEIIFLGIKKIV